jgi:hypothetical protein
VQRQAIAPALLVLVTALALAGCTASPGPTAEPTGASPATGAPAASGGLPSCEAVGTALGALVTGLPFDEPASSPSTTESYEQRVCVFGPADGRIGVTVAAIPFLQTELDVYGASPNVIADTRTGEHGSVLQALVLDDANDGHLDSALYLFDLEYSITIQQSGATVLPQLTVLAATDALFAVRALIG